MKRRVLLDVDGVSANFIQATLDTLVELGGPKVGHDEITIWNMLDCFPPEWKKPLINSWMEPGWCRKIPVYQGAKEGVQQVRKHAEVLFVTTPMPNAPFWMWERDQWLRDHFGADSRDVIFATSKHAIVGDMLVDDKLENVAEWTEHHPAGTGVLWDSPTNRNVHLPKNVVRASTWDQLIHLL